MTGSRAALLPRGSSDSYAWRFLSSRFFHSSLRQRPTIYSVLDGQACMDHDRSDGEGVGIQTYTLIKLRVPADAPHFAEGGALSPVAGRDVFLVAATLRPETMYGQTNCFVLPTGTYGAFEMASGDVFVCTERSAKIMSYQEMSEGWGVVKKLAEFKGQEIMGVPLQAPNAKYPIVYVDSHT